jgi:hypothetical protein
VDKERERERERERENGGQGRRLLLLSGPVPGPTFQIFGIGYTVEHWPYFPALPKKY